MNCQKAGLTVPAGKKKLPGGELFFINLNHGLEIG